MIFLFYNYSGVSVLLLALLNHVGERALAAVVTVEVHGHEDARAAELVRALLPEPLDLVVRVHLVELQHCELHLLPLVLNLLRLGVGLLLTLLRTPVQARGHEEGGLLTHAILGQSLPVLEGAPAEDELLILLERDETLHIGNGLGVRDRQSLPAQSFDENLHDEWSCFFCETSRLLLYKQVCLPATIA